ncbi:hypothetical protein ACLOJK_020832 [Asimina triloba]
MKISRKHRPFEWIDAARKKLCLPLSGLMVLKLAGSSDVAEDEDFFVSKQGTQIRQTEMDVHDFGLN